MNNKNIDKWCSEQDISLKYILLGIVNEIKTDKDLRNKLLITFSFFMTWAILYFFFIGPAAEGKYLLAGQDYVTKDKVSMIFASGLVTALAFSLLFLFHLVFGDFYAELPRKIKAKIAYFNYQGARAKYKTLVMIEKGDSNSEEQN